MGRLRTSEADVADNPMYPLCLSMSQLERACR